MLVEYNKNVDHYECIPWYENTYVNDMISIR